MKEQWQKIESWLMQQYPEMITDLNQGCTQAELLGFEKETGFQLPQSFKDFYLSHNGQKGENYLGLFYDVSLLPLQRIVDEWRMWSRIADEWNEEENSEFQSSLMPNKVKALYVNKKWLPFAVIWDSNYLGLDFDPEINGNVGQVINFGREEEQKTVLDGSFDEFVNWFLNQLECGNYLIGTEDGSKFFIQKDLETRFIGEPKSHFLGYVANRFISLEEEAKFAEG